MESPLRERLAARGSRRVEANTVLCLDLSDLRKEYAKKMEYLASVRDGSTGNCMRVTGCATSRRRR